MDDKDNRAENAIYTPPDRTRWPFIGEEASRINPTGFNFAAPHRIILKLTNDGRMELGEGASVDEATQMLFNMMAGNMQNLVAKLISENERLRQTLKTIAEIDTNYFDISAAIVIARDALKEKE